MHLRQISRNPRAILPYVLLLSACALVVGLVARFASFRWNSRLFGDVNLFALTAREFVTTGRLFYPMKYDYTEQVEYLTFASPSSAHNPLWPLIGGLIGRLSSIHDTFYILKVVCMGLGFLLIAIVFVVGVRGPWRLEALIASSLISVSPTLVDFSANGSPYIFIAVIFTLSIILIDSLNFLSPQEFVVAGILCGVGYLVHNSLVWLLLFQIAWWIWNRSIRHWSQVLLFLCTYIVILAPFALWNLRHFGRLHYSLSSYGLLDQFNIVKTQINGSIISTRIVGTIESATIAAYVGLVLARTIRYFQFFAQDLGPLGLGLLGIGFAVCFNQNRRRFMGFVVPAIIYTVTLVLAVEPKYRHIVPLLPVAFIVMAFGFVDLVQRKLVFQVFGVVMLIGSVVWSVPSFYSAEPTRYLGEETAWRADKYDKMRPLAIQLADLKPGVVLGYSSTGSIESVYYHGFQFIYAYTSFGAAELQKLVKDFNVRYVWADRTTREQVQTYFPNSRLLLSNANTYYIFDVTNAELELIPEQVPKYLDRALTSLICDLDISDSTEEHSPYKKTTLSTGNPAVWADGYWQVAAEHCMPKTTSGSIHVVVKPPDGKSWDDISQEFYVINSWPSTEPSIFMRAYVPKSQTVKRLQTVFQVDGEYRLRIATDLGLYTHSEYLDLILTWQGKQARLYIDGHHVGSEGNIFIGDSWGVNMLGFGGDVLQARTFNRALSELEVKAISTTTSEHLRTMKAEATHEH